MSACRRRRNCEIAHARRLADREPRVVVDVHVHDDVARVQLPLDDLLLAAFELGHLFGGHDHLIEKSIEPFDSHLSLQGLGNRSLAIALHLEDVPIHGEIFRLLRPRSLTGFRQAHPNAAAPRILCLPFGFPPISSSLISDSLHFSASFVRRVKFPSTAPLNLRRSFYTTPECDSPKPHPHPDSLGIVRPAPRPPGDIPSLRLSHRAFVLPQDARSSIGHCFVRA